jgi:2'-hydroxyisoflavone reductase
MRPSRRDFIQSSIAMGAAAALPARALPAAAQLAIEPAPRPLELLILGGTSFLGPAVVDHALARGHRVTLFNRGRTNADLYPDLEKLRGDRDPAKGEGLGAIEKAIEDGRRWDAVIDPSGHFPRIVTASATLLAGATGQYVYVSSISAYAEASGAGTDESAPVGTMEDETLETFGPSFEYYGPLKALCEQAAEKAMPGRATNIRPGLIVGPRDWSDRFTYWPVRVSQGGEVLAPNRPDDPTQYIDVRDLGAFVVTCCERRTFGLFNATGPVGGSTMADLLHGCKAVTGGDARFTWVDAGFLEEHGVHGWMHMPAWVRPDQPGGGLLSVSIERARIAGLATRPLADTVSALLEWFRGLPAERQAALGPDAVEATAENQGDATIVKRRAGISAAREREVLAAWHARAG